MYVGNLYSLWCNRRRLTEQAPSGLTRTAGVPSKRTKTNSAAINALSRYSLPRSSHLTRRCDIRRYQSRVTDRSASRLLSTLYSSCSLSTWTPSKSKSKVLLYILGVHDSAWLRRDADPVSLNAVNTDAVCIFRYHAKPTSFLWLC